MPVLVAPVRLSRVVEQAGRRSRSANGVMGILSFVIPKAEIAVGGKWIPAFAGMTGTFAGVTVTFTGTAEDAGTTDENGPLRNCTL